MSRTLSPIDAERRIALLEASLREILRINHAAENDPQSMGMETALEGALLRDWQRIRQRAERLLSTP